MKRGVLCKHCVPYEDSNKIYCKLKKCDIEGYKCDIGESLVGLWVVEPINI